MRLPSDIISRLKANALQSSRARRGHTRLVLKQWVFILGAGLLLVVLVSLYATYRFYYWSNVEETVAGDNTGAASFDEAAVEKILKEFEEKELTTQSLLKQPVQSTSSPVSTNTPGDR